MDIQRILEDTSRASVREELVVMARDVRSILEQCREELLQANERLMQAQCSGDFLALWHSSVASRLEGEFACHNETYANLMELAGMADLATTFQLVSDIKAIRSNVRPYFGLNPGGLPWHIRSRLDDALMHLS